jgi:hypothetical protein
MLHPSSQHHTLDAHTTAAGAGTFRAHTTNGSLTAHCFFVAASKQLSKLVISCISHCTTMGVLRSFCGFTAVLVAALAVWLSLPPARVELSSNPMPLPSPLTEAQQQEYAGNGVVLVKQLFQGEQLAELISDSKQALKKISLMDFVATSYHKLVFGLWHTRTPFAKAAFESSMPSIAQQLLHEQKSVRILKVQHIAYLHD